VSGVSSEGLQQTTLEKDGHVAVLTLRRPDRLNAFTDTMEHELIECFDRTDADPDVRAVVVTGSGRAFCAGMDLAEAGPGATFESWRLSESAPEGTTFTVDGHDLPIRRDGGGRVVLRIFDSLKPVIAAINGPAIGVGLTMTLPMDVRFAAADTKIAVPFTRRAFVPESCSSWFLPRVVGVPTALDWLLTGRTFLSEEAYDAGLFRSLHAAEEVLPAALAYAHALSATASPVSAALTRQLVWRMLTADHPMVAHELETVALNVRGTSSDAHEGVAAFFERRDPVFAEEVGEEVRGFFAHLPEPPYTPRG
jgi:enoyl-CoA hydratase/carnithine racemase